MSAQHQLLTGADYVVPHYMGVDSKEVLRVAKQCLHDATEEEVRTLPRLRMGGDRRPRIKHAMGSSNFADVLIALLSSNYMGKCPVLRRTRCPQKGVFETRGALDVVAMKMAGQESGMALLC
jgi:hypothetical protein